MHLPRSQLILKLEQAVDGENLHSAMTTLLPWMPPSDVIPPVRPNGGGREYMRLR